MILKAEKDQDKSRKLDESKPKKPSSGKLEENKTDDVEEDDPEEGRE